MIFLYTKTIALYFIILTIFGCGSIQTTNHDLDLKDKAYLKTKELSSWKANGKMSVTTSQRNTILNFIWIEKNNYKIIEFFGAFGRYKTTLHITPNYAKLVDQTGKSTTASSANELLNAKFGLTIPIDKLSSWLRVISLNKNNKMEKRFSDGQWKVSFLEWKLANNYYLPYSIRIKQQPTDEKQNIIDAKIIIKSWSDLVSTGEQ